MPESSHHICPYAAALSDDEESYQDPTSPHTGSNNHRSPNFTTTTTEDALSLARSKCPAFADNSCPFRGANDPESLREVMKNVPPSHFPSSSAALQAMIASRSGDDQRGEGRVGVSTPTAFQLAMEHIHRVSNYLGTARSGQNSKFNNHEDGGRSLESEKGSNLRVDKEAFIIPECPFKSFHKDRNSSSSSSSKTLARAMEDFSLAAIMGRMASWSDDDEDTDARHDGETFKDKSAAIEEEPIDDSEESNQKFSTEEASESTQKQPEQLLEKQQFISSSPEIKTEKSSLSHALKTGTAESHTSAENVHFVKNFIKGIIDRELYMELVTGLYHTYVTLEKLLDLHGPTCFPTLHFPKELSRTEALREDMEFWHGVGWESKPECRNPTPAVLDYVNRMEEVGRMDPLLLLSHAYTRYLGDLSGGKVLSRIARRALNLSGYDGLQFYQFEGIPSAKLFKDKYRAALDELEVTPDQMRRLVAEANVAFALNMRVFEELDVSGGVPGARVRDVKEALIYYDREIELQNAGIQATPDSDAKEAKCPFGFVGGPNPHVSLADKSDGSELSMSMKTLASSPSGSSKHNLLADKKKLTSSGARCPWPFIFFHDPMMGMRDWQTWFVIGLALCWCWSHMNDIHRG